jgi:hypothetical protein
MSMVVIKMAFFASDEPLFLGLVSFPVGQDPAEVRRQFEEQMRTKGVGGRRVEEHGTENFTVRGERVVGNRATAQDDQGRKLTQWFVLVENEGKQVLIMLMGPDGKMTHARVQAFLDTVR